MTRALLEQALEAMSGPIYGAPVFGAPIQSAMKAIRAELAKPERRTMSDYCIAELRRSGVQNDGFTAIIRVVEAFHGIKETK